ASRDDQAVSKTVDGGDDWTTTYPPSPGASNQPSPISTPTPTATPGVYPSGISLNEFMPDPASDWNGDGAADQNDEYIELYNANDFAVNLNGWQLDDMDDGLRTSPDGSPPYTVPPGTAIPARGFLILFRSQTGIALNNDGDWVRLLRPDGVVIEATEYTASRDDQAVSKTVDGGDEWTTTCPPSPGAANQPPATPTPTPTLLPVVYPVGIVLNEYMPNPETDWNGDGIMGDANDEYIELYNANDFPVDLGGWQVDDVASGGSASYTLPAGTMLEAQGFLPLWSRDTHIVLNNSGGDAVRLLRPDGVEVHSHSYTSAPVDAATSKTVDGGGEWTTAYPPSPGASNQPATPTPTPTATPTATPGVYPDGVSLNEFMPDPASDWNGDGAADQDDEYIELHNANDFAVDLSGWRLDDMDDGLRITPDGSPPYALPAGTTIPASGFLLVFRSESGIALNNDGDWVRLLRPDGVVVEASEYSASRDDQAVSKTIDGGSEWTRSYQPTPGGSNTPGGTPTSTPSPTPQLTPTPVATTVRLNEILPSPQDVDWDGNGVPSYLDEWIELTNLGEEAVDLGGWRLADGAPAGHEPERVYILPAGVTVPARGYLVIYRAQSGLALDASSEQVRLLYPDNSEADAMHYDVFSGYDQSWCRLPDGVGQWSRFCIETPGQPNQASPTSGGGSAGGGSSGGQPYDRFNYDLVPIAHARSLPDRTRLTLEGQVTVLPNVFADDEIYMEDASGGMRVYLRSAEWPPLSEGQWVRVNGRLDTFYEERQIALTRIDDIKTLQPAAPALPLPIRTGEMNEAYEGRLVQLSAPVTGYWKETTLYLDDGSGEARVTIKAATRIRRPYVNIGEVWTVVGVVSQSESGYRVLPRRETDLQRGGASAAGRAGTTARATSVQQDALAWNRAPIYLPITGAVLTVRPPAPANLWEAWLLIR
ncbi:MAG TPA: lamin tail domain-containing protein, partial [Anaerolineae bacterium]|nr:lamin tail domain-containing protein [Anaerolineae bacterium]